MKILVIRFSSLGDIVLISPLFQKIKDIYPDSHLSFLTDKKYVELFKNDPNVDRIIPYDVSLENSIYLLRFLKRVRKEYYDIIIDCHKIPRSLLFFLFARGGKRRKIKKYSIERRLMVRRHSIKTIPHVVKRYLATIDGRNKSNYKPKIFLDMDERKKIKYLLKEKQGKRRIVGIVPGASKKTKMWELEKLRELTYRLIEKDYFIIFFGNMRENEIVRKIIDGLGDSYLDLSGKTSIRELALFIEACDVLFTTDSGPMHIAVAVGTSVVTIFGPTVPEFGFSPMGNDSVIISKELACRPCSLHGTDTCPLGHHNCMRLIEVREVIMEIERMLDMWEE